MTLDYRPYQPGDETAILQLFEKSYSRTLSIDYWRWRFADNPAGPAVIFLAWSGETLAAHYAVSRVTLTVDGGDAATALSGTTMTHPDFRGMGLFPELARRTYDEMARLGMSLVWGFPNTNSHRGFIQDLQWRDIYEIPAFRCNISDRMTGEASEVNAIEAADALWDRAKTQFSIAVKRDSRYLAWRFNENPNETYRFATAPGGYAVFKRYKDEMQVVDLLVEDAPIATQLIGRIAQIGREAGAKTIAMWLPLASAVHRALEKHGFQAEGPVTYFGGLILRDLDASRVYSPFSWHYAMSDSDVY